MATGYGTKVFMAIEPTQEQRERQGFWAAVEAEPLEQVHKLAFADWLDEHGEHELAKAMRWCGDKGRHPMPSVSNPGEYIWWPVVGHERYWPESDLPTWLWDRLDLEPIQGEEES